MQLIQTEIAIVGASLGGVAAAWRAASSGRRVVLAAEFDWLGGQLTSQGVPPDEHRLIETGGASESYLRLRTALRRRYLENPDFVDNSAMTEGCNPGDGWVSRLCVEPAVAAACIEELLAPFVANGSLRILRGCTLQSARRRERRIEAVTLSGPRGERTELRADWYLDATDTGALLREAGLAYRLGKEAHAEFGESDAPPHAAPGDQQPVTMVMALRRGHAAGPTLPPPPDYAAWRRYLLPHYGYPLFSEFIPGSGRGQAVRFPLFAQTHRSEELDLWRYRRAVCSHNWRTQRDEVSLVNWAQNDYALHALLDGDRGEAAVVEAARNLSLCLLHWLRTEAPRPDGGAGYPELALAPEVLGTDDGLAQQVYVRESRRIVGLDCLAQGEIAAGADPLAPTGRADSVGIAWYNMDIHPTVESGHGVNARVRPFCLPLGSFIARDADNLVPACKNIGVTHLVNACTRVHPVEWMAGEIAAVLVDFAAAGGHPLARIHADPGLVAALRLRLHAAGIPTAWDRAQLARLSPTSH